MRSFNSLYFNLKNSNFILRILKFPGTWAVLIYATYHWRTNEKVDQLAIPYPPASLLFNTSQKYLSSNLASACQLGNHIFEVVALYGLSKRLQRTPVLFIENGYHKKMLEKTSNAIPGLLEKFLVINGSVPETVSRTKFHGKCCVFEDPEILEDIEDEHLHLTGMFYQSWKYFPDMRDILSDFLKEPSPESFGNLPKSDENTHVTCVHTRRGDFVEYQFYSSDPNFIRNALIFVNGKEIDYRAHRKTVIFGDDVEFMKGIFEDSVLSSDIFTNAKNFVSQNNPVDDLIYSKFNCDAVLISAPRSTFGFWMGYFSRGDSVYYMDVKYTHDRFYESGAFNPNDFFLPQWTPLKFLNSKNSNSIVV